MKQLNLLAFLFLAMFIAGCEKGEETTPTKEAIKVSTFDHKIINSWNQTFLEVERYSSGYRPGPAPRGLAYVGLAAYEVCVVGMPAYRSMSGVWPGFNVPAADPNLDYNYPLAINASYHYLLPLFFSKATEQQRAQIETTYANNLSKYSKNVSQDIIARSEARGAEVAEIIWNYAKTDAIGHEHYLNPFQGYDWREHTSSVGHWVPTFPGPGEAMGGVWGKARTFALKSDAEKICAAPLPFSEDTKSEFYAQALEVYAQNTPTYSYEKEWVAEYWSDDFVNLTFSPGPRWIAIAMQVFDINESNLEEAVVTVAKIGVAVNDASVGCWNSKYYYNLERPQTYIRRVMDPNWIPSLYNPMTNEEGNTPSFPAYPSGHATMASAAAEILASQFGYGYAMSDKCHEYRTEFTGKPRSFPSFFAMAQEAAWSRVPLGVHLRMDSEAGITYGTEIGRKVNNLPWKK